MEYTDVVELIDKYENEIAALKKELFKLTWYMRGGISLSEMYNCSHKDRIIMVEVINDNLKTTKESGLAFF